MRQANRNDIDVLVALMDEFYAEGGYALDRSMRHRRLQQSSTINRGHIWIIQSEREDVGHIVLTLKYAIEYGGLGACVDDLYVRTSRRNNGLATAALVQVRRLCEGAGIRALTVEVGHDNAPAQTVYRRIGFTEASGRQLLALALAAPTHMT